MLTNVIKMYRNELKAEKLNFTLDSFLFISLSRLEISDTWIFCNGLLLFMIIYSIDDWNCGLNELQSINWNVLNTVINWIEINSSMC